MIVRSALIAALLLGPVAVARAESRPASALDAMDDIPEDERTLDRFADARIEEMDDPMLSDEEPEPEPVRKAAPPAPSPTPVVAEPEPEPTPQIKRPRRTLGGTKPIRRRR